MAPSTLRMKNPGGESAARPLWLALRGWRRARRTSSAPPAANPFVRCTALWAGTSSAALVLAVLVSETAVRSGMLPAPWNGVLLATPQLLLVPAFLMLILCADNVVAAERRIWGNLAVAFALLYAVLVPMISILVAISLIDSGAEAGRQQAVLAEGSFVLVLDRLGRAYMCVSAMFTGLAFDRDGLEAWLRRLGMVNGLVGLAILAACLGLANPIGSLWAVSLPAFALFAVHFFRQMPTGR